MSLIKADFPFTVGTTSYIINTKKDNLIANVNYLKDKVKIIQLLLFGKNYLEELINDSNLKRLKNIKNDLNINYTVHLPIDLDLFNVTKTDFEKSLDVISFIFDKTENLNIKEYIIHIDRSNDFKYPEVKLNNENYDKLNFILSGLKNKFKNKYKSLLIENTSYDLIYFKKLIYDYGFNICMDIGHLYINDFNFYEFVAAFNEEIKEIHLHGFRKKKDHLSLKKVDSLILKNILDYLSNYKESLIIEVFNKRNLKESVKILNNYFLKEQ